MLAVGNAKKNKFIDLPSAKPQVERKIKYVYKSSNSHSALYQQALCINNVIILFITVNSKKIET